jgi:hypothetical protein
MAEPDIPVLDPQAASAASVAHRPGLPAADRAQADSTVAALIARAQARAGRAAAEAADAPGAGGPPALDAVRPRLAGVGAVPAAAGFGPLAAGPVEERRPPFDFSWSWRDLAGAAPFGQRLDRDTGYAVLDARTGAVDGGADRHVEAHAGFGVVVRTDRPIMLVGRVEGQVAHAWGVGAHGIGAVAVVECGVDITSLTNGVLVGDASELKWRHRLASSFPFLPDHEQGSEPVVSLWNAWGNLSVRMQPGEFTFNVGIRTRTEVGGGVGGGAAQSFTELRIIRFSLERIG